LLDEGQDGADGAGPAEADVVAASAEAMAAAYRAQAVVPEAVLEVCTRIFDTLGASATSATLRLDRHWRMNGTPPTAYTSAGEVPEGD
ncbi:acyl-CoA dehydrogenase, partial [Xanthomonas citri pv. citri]|nr:acyl-CoA dehydrogenase [Xanthomonas citri pv. citri]